jgi:L-rhamnose mutarotase
MERFHALRTRLRPGMAQAYVSAHNAVWPSLIAAQREAGITGWWIFLSGLELFHVAECEDFDAALAALAENPVDQRWQAEMARYTEPDADGRGPAAERLTLIWHR